MIRDALRRLLRRSQVPAAPPPLLTPAPPPASGPVTAAALLWWRQQGTPLVCVDLRPRSVLRYGFVDGALLLPAGRADLIPSGDVVFVGEGAPEGAWWTADLSPWEAAGWPTRNPAWKSPLPLLHPVRTADGLDGWIQDIRWIGDRFSFTVLLETGQRRAALDEEDLESRGPRGAAGLGAQI